MRETAGSYNMNTWGMQSINSDFNNSESLNPFSPAKDMNGSIMGSPEK